MLHLDDLRYAGAFRLPDDTFGSSELSYSEGPIAYHPGRHSIYIVGHSHHQAIAEFAVPALAESNVLDDLQMASAPLQAPADNSQTTLALRDADDLGGSAVKAGEQDPHEPRPYEHGVFPAVFPTTELGGGAFDPASGLLYLTLQRADTEQGTYSNPPVVVAYRFEVAGLFADGFESGDALAWSASPPE